MRYFTICFSLFVLFAVGVGNRMAFASDGPQVIVLKLDDIVTDRAPRWQRVIDFLKENELRASCGIIGFSLEDENPAYFKWIKDLHATGRIEFWNHGYRKRLSTDKTGEFEGAFDEQKKSLQRTQELAREKLGIELKAFGPHWSGTNDDTVRAIEEIPEIAMWFYGPSQNTSKFIFKRVLTLENPTHVPDFAKFKARYEEVGRNEKCLALQGHPNSWDDKRWNNFVRIIEYLKNQGCVFMTPSEYLASQSD